MRRGETLLRSLHISYVLLHFSHRGWNHSLGVQVVQKQFWQWLCLSQLSTSHGKIKGFSLFKYFFIIIIFTLLPYCIFPGLHRTITLMPSLLASWPPSLPSSSLTFLLRRPPWPDPWILHQAISQRKDVGRGVDFVSRAAAVNSMWIKHLFMINSLFLHWTMRFSVEPWALILTDSSSYLEQRIWASVVLLSKNSAGLSC